MKEEKSIVTNARLRILHNQLQDVYDGLEDMESFEDAAAVQAFFDRFIYHLWTFREFHAIPADLIAAVTDINTTFKVLNKKNAAAVEGDLFHTRKIGDVRAEPVTPARVVYEDAEPTARLHEHKSMGSVSPGEERAAGGAGAHGGAGGGHYPGTTVSAVAAAASKKIKDSPELKVSDDHEILDFGDGVKVIANIEAVDGVRMIAHLTPVVESEGDSTTMEPITVKIPRKVHGKNSEKFFDEVEFRWVEALGGYVVYGVTMGGTGESQFTKELIEELIALTANWNEAEEYIGEVLDYVTVDEASDGSADNEGDGGDVEAGEESIEKLPLPDGNVIVAIKNEHGQVTNLYIQDVDTDKEHKKIAVTLPRLDVDGEWLEIFDEIIFCWKEGGDGEEAGYEIAEINIGEEGRSQFTGEFIAAATEQLEKAANDREEADRGGDDAAADGYPASGATYIPAVAMPMPSYTPVPTILPTPSTSAVVPAPTLQPSASPIATEFVVDQAELELPSSTAILGALFVIGSGFL
jgi:hypothetical protein